MLTPPLLSPSASLVNFDRLLLVYNAQPDPIKLDHWRHLCDRLSAGLLYQGFPLIDPLCERAQPHLALQVGTPLLAQIAQDLTQAAAEEHLLIEIIPKALIL